MKMKLKNKFKSYLLSCLFTTPAIFFVPQSVAQSVTKNTTIVNPNGTYNNIPAGLLHWRGAVASVLSGTSLTRPTIYLRTGDSTTTGAGSGTSTAGLVGGFANSSTSSLVSLLGKTLPLSFCSFFGDQNATSQVTYNQYDPRVTINAAGSGWISNGLGTLGGQIFQYNVGSTGTLTFAPSTTANPCAIDHLTIWYTTRPSNGTVTPLINATPLTTINSGVSGSPTFTSRTYSFTKGTYTITLLANNDGQLEITGIIAWDSTVPAIDVVQAGNYGIKVATLANTASVWSGLNALKALAPIFTEVNLEINDSNGGTTLSSYRTSWQSIITGAKISGDVLIGGGLPSNTSQATNGTLTMFNNVLKSLAITNNIPMFDAKQYYTSYVITNAIPGLTYFDSLHGTKSLYIDYIRRISAIIYPQ